MDNLKDLIIIALIVSLFTMVCMSTKQSILETKIEDVPYSVDAWIKRSRNEDPWVETLMPDYNNKIFKGGRPYLYFGQFKFPHDAMAGNV